MTRNITKAGRLLLLARLREQGILDEIPQAEIARWLDVHRSTILKDLCVLNDAQAEVDRLMAKQPWIRRRYTVQEVAETLGVDIRIIRDMCGAGIMHATRDGQAHSITIEEIERWQRFLSQ